MAGAVLNPQQLTGTVDMSTGQTPSMSHMNSFRISAVVDRLLVHVRGGSRNDSNEFFNLCLSLSRGIDYAVANNEIPVKAPELPGLLKQVCQLKNDAPLQAAIMVLFISIKSACRNGWFSEKDKEELQILSHEISSSFCSDKDMNSKDNTFHHNISPIMLRFYPSMKMGEVLAFVEATPGYGAFVKDFDITTKLKSSDDKIYLFVAQMDDTETSSCIISPQQVNFLLNGRAVDGRNCVYKDPGPQTPTLVTNMLKVGTNLLQVVGQFHGKYIILVAFMSMVSSPSCPPLPNYELPAVTAPDSPDSDNEIIEGPSTISLNCPISFKRIKTPVKGQLCKHPQVNLHAVVVTQDGTGFDKLSGDTFDVEDEEGIYVFLHIQDIESEFLSHLFCFDYENYVDINSRRPSWRCPHCTQSVSFTDIRIDRIMVKVLKEVGMNISHVKISADGSWEVVTEGDDHTDKPVLDESPSHQQSTSSQNMGPDVMDLTGADNYMNATDPHQDIDKKPSPAQLQNHPNQIPTNQIIPANNPVPPHKENGAQKIQQPHGSANTKVPPVPKSTQVSASKNTNLKYRRPGMHVTRIPNAVQALPAGNIRQQGLDRFHHVNPHRMMRMGPQESRGYGYNGGHEVDQFDSIRQLVRSHGHMSPPPPHPPPQGLLGPTPGLIQARHHAMSPTQQAVHVSSWTLSMQENRAPRDQNWQPSGRMRGSLSGQAYEDALNRLIYFPPQPIQATRPPLLNTPRPVSPPHLQFLMANNRNMMSFQDAENWRF